MTFLSQVAPGFEPDHAEALLIISSETPATGTVEIAETYLIDGAWQTYRTVEPFSVEAGKKTKVTAQIPLGFDDNQFDRALPTAIHILSDSPVAVHGLFAEDYTTDGSLILPNGLLGQDHFLMSYRNSPSFDGDGITGGTQLAVVATKDQTAVTITPTAATPAHPANQPFTVTLQQGEVYRMINRDDAEGDFTGTRVQSDKPVAVFSGHVCATVPATTPACDHLYEQIPPVDSWGRHFVTLPLKTRTGGDRFRMLAAHDATSVSINGEIVAVLNRGQFYETVLSQPASIVANQGILLAQFAQSSGIDHTTGDPFLMLVPPYETFGRHYILGTQSLYSHYTDSELDPYDSYLSVVVDSAHIAEVAVNGQPIVAAEFAPIGESGFSGASISVPKDSTIEVSAPVPLGAWIYGWADYESYGFTGGMYGAIDSTTASFQLTQTADAALVGSVHHVRAALVNAAGLPLQDSRVNFSVVGANPGTSSGLTSADGTVEFSWQGNQAGLDSVTATCGILSDNASVTWVAAGGNQPPQVNAGSDVLVKLGEPLTLHGVAQDDGLPAGGSLALHWSTLPGPGDVTFSDPGSGETTASFLYPGQYTLRLTAYDGQFAGEDDLIVMWTHLRSLTQSTLRLTRWTPGKNGAWG